jgi:NarL family two-component system response regulator LiaR
MEGMPMRRSTMLTPREQEVLKLIAQGKTNQEIAEELSISLPTVRTHISNIFNKLGLSSRAEAAAYAALHGLVNLSDLGTWGEKR